MQVNKDACFCPQISLSLSLSLSLSPSLSLSLSSPLAQDELGPTGDGQCPPGLGVLQVARMVGFAGGRA